MQKYIIVLIILIVILFCLSCLYINEPFDNSNNENYSWSKNWNQKDFEARKDADCNPIAKKYMDDFVIYTMPKSCEQGLPHTRHNNVVAIPENFPERRFNITLEHEKVHIDQKKNPEKWKAFYLNKWHYKIHDSPPSFMPVELINNKRANPDTGDEPWCCWKDRWWSVPVYKENNVSLSQATIKWYDQETKQVSNKPPKEWIDFFGNDIFQLEHPHEISAVLLSGPLFNKKSIDVDFTPAMVALAKFG